MHFHYNKSRKLLSGNLGYAAVHSRFVLSLRMLPPLLPSLSVHSAVSSSPLSSTWRSHHFLQATFSAILPSRGGSFHSTSSSGNSYFILLFLCFMQFCAILVSWPVLCGHNCADFWCSNADVFTSKVFSTQLFHQWQQGRCRGAINHPSTEPQVKVRSAWRSNVINAGHQLKHIISTLKQFFSEIW